jgi:hypothetical protein
MRNVFPELTSFKYGPTDSEWSARDSSETTLNRRRRKTHRRHRLTKYSTMESTTLTAREVASGK